MAGRKQRSPNTLRMSPVSGHPSKAARDVANDRTQSIRVGLVTGLVPPLTARFRTWPAGS